MAPDATRTALILAEKALAPFAKTAAPYLNFPPRDFVSIDVNVGHLLAASEAQAALRNHGQGEEEEPRRSNYNGKLSDKEQTQPSPEEAPAPAGETEPMVAIRAERQRQIEVEGWSPDHDDSHVEGELLQAAYTYYEYTVRPNLVPVRADGTPAMWPWGSQWWKPKDRRANLIRAGALCLAESERIKRGGSGRWTGHVDHKLSQIVAAFSHPSAPTAAPQPVAWRYLERGTWTYHHGSEPVHPGNDYPLEPLYTAAPPVSARPTAADTGSGEGLQWEVEKAFRLFYGLTFTPDADKALSTLRHEMRNVARPNRPFDEREFLGRVVREAWVAWARGQPNPKPTWLVPYDQLAEADKEADRQIGEAVILLSAGGAA